MIIKKLKDCSAKELIDNYELNSDNDNFMKMITTLEFSTYKLGINDYDLKCQILNDVFEDMKSGEHGIRLFDEIVNTEVMING